MMSTFANERLLMGIDCGNELVNGAVLGAEADCSMGCAGNATLVFILPIERNNADSCKGRLAVVQIASRSTLQTET